MKLKRKIYNWFILHIFKEWNRRRIYSFNFNPSHLKGWFKETNFNTFYIQLLQSVWIALWVRYVISHCFILDGTLYFSVDAKILERIRKFSEMLINNHSPHGHIKGKIVNDFTCWQISKEIIIDTLYRGIVLCHKLSSESLLSFFDSR